MHILRQKLASILYDVAAEGHIDPQVVLKILGVTREEAIIATDMTLNWFEKDALLQITGETKIKPKIYIELLPTEQK